MPSIWIIFFIWEAKTKLGHTKTASDSIENHNFQYLQLFFYLMSISEVFSSYFRLSAAVLEAKKIFFKLHFIHQ